MRIRSPHIAAVALAAALSLGAAALPATAATATTGSTASPATAVVVSASAVQNADGSYTLSWTAYGSGTVHVYASTDPSNPAESGTLVATAPPGSTGVTVTGLSTAQRWYFDVAPVGVDYSVVTSTTAVGLQGTQNTRDIGGYRTSDGFTVRWGQVFRSDALNKATAADDTKLSGTGITVNDDFRTSTEVTANGANVLPAGVQANAVPVSDGGIFSLTNQAIRSGNPTTQQNLLGNGQATALMVNLYKSFVDDPTARAQFATVIRQIASGQRVLYNCSAGKDRTGWMTAVLLTALGVPQSTVYQDYMLSNTYLAAGNARLKAGLQASGLMQNPDLLDPLLTVQSSYLDAAFAEATSTYGSFSAYVTNGLGIDETTLVQLKIALLTI